MFYTLDNRRYSDAQQLFRLILHSSEVSNWEDSVRQRMVDRMIVSASNASELAFKIEIIRGLGELLRILLRDEQALATLDVGDLASILQNEAICVRIVEDPTIILDFINESVKRGHSTRYNHSKGRPFIILLFDVRQR